MITKEDLVKYFQDGCKKENNLKIGVEHEKFLFNSKLNQRINFETVTKVFNYLGQFGWKPIKENGLIIGLKKDDANILVCPGCIAIIRLSLE